MKQTHGNCKWYTPNDHYYSGYGDCSFPQPRCFRTVIRLPVEKKDVMDCGCWEKKEEEL